MSGGTVPPPATGGPPAAEPAGAPPAEPAAGPGQAWGRVRVALSGAGLLVAAYLTLLHYTTVVPLACPDTGAVDCAQVLTSPQSVVLGVPVAAYGLVWFAIALWLAVRTLRPEPGVERLQLAWTLLGTVVVLYLVATELLVIGKICIWCTTVHVLVLALLVLQVLAPRAADRAD